MAVIPEITCRRCGSKYSGLRSRCPKCGAPRMNQPTRVPPTTASATAQTAASARSAANIRWQYLFGGVLLLAVVLAVIVLVASGRGSGSSNSSNNSSSVGNTTPSYLSADLPTPSPSPEPTPEATPTPMIESISITFLNRPFTNHAAMLTNAGEIFNVDFDVLTYPEVDDSLITWRSTNEKILTVNERGFVTVVGASPDFTVHAGIIVSCGGLEDYVTVYVPSFQAAYLTENLFDPETYQADNLEWDTFINTTPNPG